MGLKYINEIKEVFNENSINFDENDINADLELDSLTFVSTLISLEGKFDVAIEEGWLSNEKLKSINDFNNLLLDIL